MLHVKNKLLFVQDELDQFGVSKKRFWRLIMFFGSRLFWSIMVQTLGLGKEVYEHGICKVSAWRFLLHP